MGQHETDIYDLYKRISTNNVIISYVGMFNFNISNNLLTMFKKHVAHFGIKLIYKKKLYNVMVEALDNVCKHNIHQSTDGANQIFPGIFLLEKIDNDFIITTGNLILNNKVEALRKKLDFTNSLDKDELKEKYKEMIINGSISEIGGAGIGFLDMSIKAGSKLEFDFKKLDEHLTFFTFKVKIATEKL